MNADFLFQEICEDPIHPRHSREEIFRTMKVTEQDVQYVADLANLELTADEQARMVRDLNAILGHIDKLNELDTKDVPPMAQALGSVESGAGANPYEYAWRNDEVRPCLDRAVVMKGAPVSDGEFFKVPKVIEK